MFNRSLKKLFNRPLRHSTNLLPRRNHHRRLHCEALEDRRMLSIGGYPDLPGLVLVDPVPDQFEGQIVYLDFDGAEDVTYNGPVVVEGIDIPAFEAPGELAGHEQEIIASVVNKLEDTFADTGLTFTIDKPDPSIDYSTVFIGGDDGAFSEYGSFHGLAEQVDIGNRDLSDIAFVFSGEIYDITTLSAFATDLSGTIIHEAGHLIGFAHDWPENNDMPLSSVADADPNDQISEAIRFTKPAPGEQTYPGNSHIDNPTDVDMWKVSVNAGDRLAFDLDDIQSWEFDSYLRLFNSSGNQLDYSDDDQAPGESGGNDAYLEYTFTSSGTYYVGISGWPNTSYNPVTGTGDSSGATGMCYFYVKNLTLPPPDPELVSVSISDSTVRPGEMFTVTITADNDGGETDEGSIHAVVRYADGTDNVVVSELRNVSWADHAIHWQPGEGAGQIYNKGSATPRSQAAQDWFLEAVDTPWPASTRRSMTFDVTPEKAGNLQVLVRTTMHTGPDPEDWDNDISANTGNPTTNDEQGWQTRVYPVQVAYAPHPDLVSVSISDSSVEPGQTFTVTVTADNDGSQTDEGSIHAVVRYADGTDNVVVSELRNVSWADHAIHWQPGEGAGQIYNKGSATPRSQAAQDWFLEAVDTPWSGSTRRSMTFDVTPEKAGNLQVLVRTTMHTGPDPDRIMHVLASGTFKYGVTLLLSLLSALRKAT